MSSYFSEIAEIRLGYGLSPRFAPPADVDAVMAATQTVGPVPDAMTTAQASQIRVKFADLGKAKVTGV